MLVVSFAPHGIEGIEIDFVGVEPFDKYKNKHLFFTRIPRIRGIIRRFQPDLVFAPYLSSNGLTAALCWKGPLIVSARGGDVLEQAGRTGLRRRMRQATIRYVCRRADAVHTVSAELDEALLAIGVPREKLVRFPLGVDVRAIRPRQDGPAKAAERIICTRQHEPIYDNLTIVDALATLRAKGRRFECVFVGGGHQLQATRARATEHGLGDCLRFTDHLPPEQVGGLLKVSDLYVSASLSDGTSSSLLEAMAAGLFPVVSRIRANRVWLREGETALMFDPGDAIGLANALARAMDDGALRAGAIVANRKRVEDEGDITRNMERMAELFERTLAARRGETGAR